MHTQFIRRAGLHRVAARPLVLFAWMGTCVCVAAHGDEDVHPVLTNPVLVLMLIIGTVAAAFVAALVQYLIWRDGKRSNRERKLARRRRRREIKARKRELMLRRRLRARCTDRR
jgi:hypothetical protein